ncbi:hypothetical protein [Georgenia sp. SUBG003]|uniref:hypothetical protein n=1 Tax=Georgenia sp. SUBG003 TaxID=1497974 RepID=UPI003AB640F7
MSGRAVRVRPLRPEEVPAAELMPDSAGAAFTGCLFVGALTAIAAPALAGAVIPGLGLAPLLLLSAAVSLLSGLAMLLHASVGRRWRYREQP